MKKSCFKVCFCSKEGNKVILNSVQDLRRKLLSFVNGMRGRCQIKFGMTALYNNGGFTLIELLVVVLIIGILAAVAVPQYKVAVTKSRVGAMLPLMASIAQAQETYYLANGEYAPVASVLDVDIPGDCTKIEDRELGTEFKCSKYFVLGVYHDGMVNINYCPDHNATFTDCAEYREIHITFRPLHYNQDPSENGQRICKAYHSSKLAKAVCASLGLIDKAN